MKDGNSCNLNSRMLLKALQDSNAHWSQLKNHYRYTKKSMLSTWQFLTSKSNSYLSSSFRGTKKSSFNHIFIIWTNFKVNRERGIVAAKCENWLFCRMSRNSKHHITTERGVIQQTLQPSTKSELKSTLYSHGHSQLERRHYWCVCPLCLCTPLTLFNGMDHKNQGHDADGKNAKKKLSAGKTW